MDEPVYLSTAEAASRLGISQSTVRRRCESGELLAEWNKGNWRIPAPAVEPRHHLPAVPELVAERLAHLPLLLSPKQAGDVLGMSEWSVQRACKLGHISHRRIGRLVRVPLAVIVEILSGGAAA